MRQFSQTFCNVLQGSLFNSTAIEESVISSKTDKFSPDEIPLKFSFSSLFLLVEVNSEVLQLYGIVNYVFVQEKGRNTLKIKNERNGYIHWCIYTMFSVVDLSTGEKVCAEVEVLI